MRPAPESRPTRTITVTEPQAGERIPPPPAPPNGMALGSLVAGIAGLLVSIIPIIGLISWVLAPAGLVMGFLSLKKPTRKAMSIAGLVTSGLALIICILWAVFLAAAVANGPVAPIPTGELDMVQAPRSSEDAGDQMWVRTERTERHTCPSGRCGIVGRLSFRESARVLERKDGWARVSRTYDAMCANGRSELIEEGPASCTPENGVVDGMFSEWVPLASLSSERPADPAASATVQEAMIAQSDDFPRHRLAFVRAANQLIAEGRCTRQDFEDVGGWSKSSTHRNQPVYFTYCGGMTITNRIYLDANTGRTFQ